MAKIHTPIPTLKLNDGNSIPMLGFGLGTAWYKQGDESVIDQGSIDGTKLALKLEYYHLDGAEMYKNETELGRAIKESGVPREKLFVTTKVFQNLDNIHNGIRQSLKKLQLDYVDLYLIHNTHLAKTDKDLQRRWADMEQVKADGLAKSIGVSNYEPDHIEATLKTAKVKPVINQIEFHAYLQHRDLLEVHKKHDIATQAYGPLSPITKGAPGPIDEYIAALAKKYAVDPTEILLRWCIDQDVVAVTTSGKEQRLSDYLRVATFKLTPAEVKDLSELGAQKHFKAF